MKTYKTQLKRVLNAIYPFTFDKAVKTAVVITTFLSAAGCGKTGVYSTTSGQQELPPVGVPSVDGVVVKARAIVSVTPGVTGLKVALTGTQSINVTNAANVSMTLSNASWVVPSISNASLDFGFLEITDVKDNNLDICGSGGNQHCTKALFRIYTTGKPGAGIWNATGAYGMPITAGLSGTTPGTVGLDVAGAYTLQSVTIPANKHTIKFQDFSPTPKYNVKSDFTDAGAGSYSATLVIEYALAP